MTSIQGRILEVWLRRQKFFGTGAYNPPGVRAQLEAQVARLRPRRDVRIVPIQADGVPAEWLLPACYPPDRALLYIHGGAWFMGSARTHRPFVASLAAACGVRALSVNYRLAPEYPFPLGLGDCITAFEWLCRSGIPAQRIVIAGDSAGGNLTLAVLVALRDAGSPLPSGAVAISPATDLALTGDSVRTRAHVDPLLGNAGSKWVIDDYVTDHDPRHPLISPLYADLRGLPPLLIHTGDHEMLLDDAVRFGKRALEAGIQARTVVWPGMFHVFQMFSAVLPEARQANREIAAFIRSCLDLPPASE